MEKEIEFCEKNSDFWYNLQFISQTIGYFPKYGNKSSLTKIKESYFTDKLFIKKFITYFEII